MATLKTQPGKIKVDDYLESLPFDSQIIAHELIDIMQDVTGEAPVMWGSSIVGFGTLHYKYASGREADWLRIGFSSRKTKTSLYITYQAQQYQDELGKLGGKVSTGKGCIYLQKFDDIDRGELRKLIKKAYIDSKQYDAV